jgi:hypothetical protein
MRNSAIRAICSGLTVGSRPLYSARAPSFLTIWETNSTLLVLPMPTTLLALCWIKRVLYESVILAQVLRELPLEEGTYLILSEGVTATIDSMQPAPIPAVDDGGISH